MNKLEVLSFSLFFTVAACGFASASSSAWYESQGGRVRLVTTGTADQAGRIQGVLEIALKPGWKTYWRDPGDSGVPPQIDVNASANVAGVDLSFPAPQRHDDGYGQWAGYDRSVALPAVFTLKSPGDKALIEAHVFLGICETICIPVQTTLSVDPASDPDNATDAELVKTAFAALPQAERSDFRAVTVAGDDETLNVEVAAPGAPDDVDFFVAGNQDYMFGPPTRTEQNGKVLFSVPILDRPDTIPAGAGLHYTVTGTTGAVEGLLPYP
ncbi:protein-disulfide reductase DsbD domain-containing protein [Mesorhizobium sp. BE184]|uniref:protein-disulfide reductase DsbD domain-containing protein n=1 Tax=Mesorhizobium sp. BE184 TaxID=2817714 RepID=UPI002862B442|nr:protein-disulfide reductase DsbD domain-containing protein [Mesorhizobium sp. BE184]MDR7031627.1 DsbC/DsbD-like thiol-disulfide interchange protein [Mesorhizobium sp. BE184]